MWPRLHWPTSAVVRDTTELSAQTWLVLCCAVQQAHKDNLVLMQQKATENIKHLRKEHPHCRPEAIPPLCVRVYMDVFVFFCANDTSLWEGLYHTQPPYSPEPCVLARASHSGGFVRRISSRWRSWLAVQQHKLCSATTAQLQLLLRQRDSGPRVLQGSLLGVWAKSGPCWQSNGLWGVRVNHILHNTPRMIGPVCSNGSHFPTKWLSCMFC